MTASIIMRMLCMGPRTTEPAARAASPTGASSDIQHQLQERLTNTDVNRDRCSAAPLHGAVDEGLDRRDVAQLEGRAFQAAVRHRRDVPRELRDLCGR